jgi:biotin-(acetyl-CoA carboxylase) ligase
LGREAINLQLVIQNRSQAQMISQKKMRSQKMILRMNLSLYLTDEQTKGRGRFDRTWSMPKPGSALISSWSFQIMQPPKPTLTALAGLALIQQCANDMAVSELVLEGPE